MEELYRSFALINAGVSLAMGVIYLFVAINRKGKTDLFFSLMALSLTVYFLIPPVGFIVNDVPPYPFNILIKRLFVFAYYAITPWFILTYTGYPKAFPARIISVTVAMSYVFVLFTNNATDNPAWAKVAIVGFGAILYLGVHAGIWQYHKRDKEKARWLLTAVSIYGALFLLTPVMQFTQGGFFKSLGLELFLPMHMHALFFMMVMGLRLVVSLLEKYKLEEVVRSTESRWRSFMQNAPVLVVEIDKTGNILYINDFGVKLLGYSDARELLRANWFDRFLLPAGALSLKKLYSEAVSVNVMPSTFKNSIRDKRGRELMMSWVNFVSRNEAGGVNIMSIGRDMSSEESANRLVARLQQELEKEKIHLTDSHQNVEGDIAGRSKALTYAIQKAKQVATTHAPVLLEGETGVGKELFADLIHRESSRSEKPLIKVNCGALPKDLIEDELFGHEKGAFTSAIQARKGRFELADGGTIFLDEIGELPLDMQPKLLRVLQNGEFERVGGQKTIKVDVRILAATNRILSTEIQNGTFREDLYYRLNVFPITIPPLRSREEDLPELIHYFIRRKCKKYNKKFDQVSKANMQRLLTYNWPGNIRELKNVIERAVIVSEGKTLAFDWWLQDRATPAIHEASPPSPNQTLEQIEKDHILAVIEKCNWRINGEHGAAEVLAMHPNTLRSKMKKLGIKRPQAQEVPQLQES